VHSHNRANLNYTLDLNHLSDVFDEEFEMLKGQSYPDTPELRQELNDIPQLRITIPKTLPKKLDWREYGIYFITLKGRERGLVCRQPLCRRLKKR